MIPQSRRLRVCDAAELRTMTLWIHIATILAERIVVVLLREAGEGTSWYV
jgi:hypothetical protein